MRQIPTGRRNYVTGELEVLHRLELKQCIQIPLGTSYPDIAHRVRNVLQHFEVHRKATLVIDAGGPGLPFIDFLNTHPLDAHLVKLNITGSGAPRYNNGIYQVTRAQLLTNLRLLFEKRVLHLPQDDLLLTELRGLRSGFTSEADHDDLVMSLALGAWEANKSWHARL